MKFIHEFKEELTIFNWIRRSFNVPGTKVDDAVVDAFLDLASSPIKVLYGCVPLIMVFCLVCTGTVGFLVGIDAGLSETSEAAPSEEQTEDSVMVPVTPAAVVPTAIPPTAVPTSP